MIKSLRSYHFKLWRALAVMLPLAFTMALVLRPITSQKQIDQNEFFFSLKKSEDHSVINIRLLNSLQSPSCLVYALPRVGDKFLLGSIHQTGEYTFSSTQAIIGIQLFDLLRQKEIHMHYFEKVK